MLFVNNEMQSILLWLHCTQQMYLIRHEFFVLKFFIWCVADCKIVSYFQQSVNTYLGQVLITLKKLGKAAAWVHNIIKSYGDRNLNLASLKEYVSNISSTFAGKHIFGSPKKTTYNDRAIEISRAKYRVTFLFFNITSSGFFVIKLN